MRRNKRKISFTRLSLVIIVLCALIFLVSTIFNFFINLFNGNEVIASTESNDIVSKADNNTTDSNTTDNNITDNHATDNDTTDSNLAVNTTKNTLSMEYISSLIKSSPVICTVTDSTNLYAGPSLSNYKKIGNVKENTKLEILEDRSTVWYRVKDLANNQIGWIEKSHIKIPLDPETNKNTLTKDQLEFYVNNKDFTNHTDQFVWVDIDRQLTYVFSGSKNNWKLIKTITVATGLNESPTTRGKFTIQKRGNWFYAERFASGAKNWVQFNGNYLFHSVSMDKNMNIKDPILGERRSSGCVRMSVEDSEWFYNTIKRGTTIYVD